jgi:hypothetical protein
MKNYIKGNFVFLVLCLAFAGFSVVQSDGALLDLVIKVAIYLLVLPLLHYLFISKLKWDEQGPIPMHQSPLFWVGVPVIMVLVYVFV